MAKRLLVVDDEPHLLRAVELVLRSEGFEVKTVRSAREALVSVAESLPDLIVSDIRMPGMDGYALARKLRALPHVSIVPIVFLTAKDEIEDRVQGFRAGVDVYLTKPFDPDELVAVITNVLRRVEQTRSAIARICGREEPEQIFFVRDDELTESETLVAQSVARGLANKEIASELHLSVRTIENYVSRILSKKHFSNRVEIARHMISHQPE